MGGGGEREGRETKKKQIVNNVSSFQALNSLYTR